MGGWEARVQVGSGCGRLDLGRSWMGGWGESACWEGWIVGGWGDVEVGREVGEVGREVGEVGSEAGEVGWYRS